MKRFVVIGMLLGSLALTGCGIVQVNMNGQPLDTSSPGAAVNSAKDNAGAAACATIRAQIDQQYTVAQSNTINANVTVSFGSLVSKLGVKCPAGGTYTWDEAAKTTSCSIHGE